MAGGRTGFTEGSRTRVPPMPAGRAAHRTEESQPSEDRTPECRTAGVSPATARSGSASQARTGPAMDPEAPGRSPGRRVPGRSRRGSSFPGSSFLGSSFLGSSFPAGRFRPGPCRLGPFRPGRCRPGGCRLALRSSPGRPLRGSSGRDTPARPDPGTSGSSRRESAAFHRERCRPASLPPVPAYRPADRCPVSSLPRRLVTPRPASSASSAWPASSASSALAPSSGRAGRPLRAGQKQARCHRARSRLGLSRLGLSRPGGQAIRPRDIAREAQSTAPPPEAGQGRVATPTTMATGCSRRRPFTRRAA